MSEGGVYLLLYFCCDVQRKEDTVLEQALKIVIFFENLY